MSIRLDLLTALCVRLRLRQRLRPATEVNGDDELSWWLRTWNPALAGGALPADALELLACDPPRS
jgi:hypothetical protein